MIDWDSPSWGGNVHEDSHGSYLDAEPATNGERWNDSGQGDRS